MINEMKKELVGDSYNKSYTENGALGYATSGKELVDLNFKAATLRNYSASETNLAVLKAYYENPLLFCKWMFYLRDCREGLGEKMAFYNSFNCLISYNKEYAIKLIPLIPEYGSWKDLFSMNLLHNGDKDIREVTEQLIANQFCEDLKAVSKQSTSISLIGKWLPSVNAGNKSKKEAKYLCKNVFHITEAVYRKCLSVLRKQLDIVERKMCSKDFDKINYSTVPSKANLLYKDAFLKHDRERRLEFLESLKKGEAKINSSVLFPCDIYAMYNSLEVDNTLEELWKALPNMVDKNQSTIVVADGSGSMTYGFISKIEPIDVARSLAIYFSEKLTGEYKNKFITFSSNPQLVDLSYCDSLWIKKKLLGTYRDCSNTDLKKVFKLILDTAVTNNIPQEDLPKNILIISDMEFDEGCTFDKSLFNEIADEYSSKGYKLPKLIFWNVGSRTNTIPLTKNENGVILVSGYSANICRMICSAELNPYKALLSVLNTNRYQEIESVLKNE